MMHSNDRTLDDGDNLEKSTRRSLQALNVQRLALEEEAAAIEDELLDGSHHLPMGIDTPLVDAEGYPRGDIDIYRARTLRGRLASIRTDHKNLLKDIERLLHQLASVTNSNKAVQEKSELEARRKTKPKPKFDSVTGKWVVKNWDGSIAGVSGGQNRQFDHLQEESPITTTTSTILSNAAAVRTASGPRPSATAATTTTLQHQLSGRPFARIDSIASSESPAARAGLLVDDLLVSVGSIHSETAQPMHAIARLIPEIAGANETVTIVIQRQKQQQQQQQNEYQYKSLRLMPAPWRGRGLLGCHIVPYTSTD